MRSLGLILLSLALAACATQTPTATFDVSSLNGTSWVLVEMNGVPPMAESTITLEIEDGLRKGYAGCNWYDERPATPPPFSNEPQVFYSLTVQDCPPKALLEQEDRYVKLLFSVSLEQAVLDGETLTLYNSSGKAVLVFAAAE